MPGMKKIRQKQEFDGDKVMSMLAASAKRIVPAERIRKFVMLPETHRGRWYPSSHCQTVFKEAHLWEAFLDERQRWRETGLSATQALFVAVDKILDKVDGRKSKELVPEVFVDQEHNEKLKKQAGAATKDPEDPYIDPEVFSQRAKRGATQEDYQWALENSYVKVRPEDAPSRFAWTLLESIRESPKVRENLLLSTMPKFALRSDDSESREAEAHDRKLLAMLEGDHHPDVIPDQPVEEEPPV